MSIELVMPSNHLILCLPLLLLPSVIPSIRVLSNQSSLHIRWPKYWSFSISPSNEAQFESINSSVLSLLYGPTLTSVHNYWKKPWLWLYGPLSAKRCLCFCIMLSRLVINFSSKEQAFFNFMAAVTICSDLGAPPKNKVCHCFHCFPIYFPWSDGTRRHNLSFQNVEL